MVESLMGLVTKIETDDQNLDNNDNSQRNAYFYMLSIVLVLGICWKIEYRFFIFVHVLLCEEEKSQEETR
jgi:Ca2+/Na+ antiporter